MVDASEACAALQQEVLRALQLEWKFYNKVYFRQGLRLPTLELADGPKPLGSWHPEVRLIRISRELALQHPWPTVVEVLKHEMAHQYVHEVLNVHDQGPHADAFHTVCARHGIDAASAGLPHVKESDEDGDLRRIMRKVEKLLALAGSSNLHEAQTAMRTAQELLVKHNLEHAAAVDRPRFGVRHLGEARTRIHLHERLLGGILAEHFFVEALWVNAFLPGRDRYGRLLEICGTEANLEFACYVHAFLLRTAENLWIEDKQKHGTRSARDRLNFMAAVIRGFARKLQEDKPSGQERALVLVRGAGLSDYFGRRHPSVRAMRGTIRYRTDVDERGEAAGRGIVLHKPVDRAADDRGRLLTSGAEG